MRKFLILIYLIFLISPKAYSYWNSSENEYKGNYTILLGAWTIMPDNSIDLNIWEDREVLNQVVPNDTIFTYDAGDGRGKLFYMVRPKQTYNPYYHGLPGSGSNLWVAFSLGLEWMPNLNYRTNSIIIRDGRYFIANSAYNNNWFVGDPLNSANLPWSEWREIEPISEESFSFIPDTNIRDYANPNWQYIIYL